jgi:hypothetical protein
MSIGKREPPGLIKVSECSLPGIISIWFSQWNIIMNAGWRSLIFEGRRVYAFAFKRSRFAKDEIHM